MPLMPLMPLTPFLEDFIEIRFSGVEEFADLYASQFRYFGVDILYRSGALVGLDEEVREWNGTERLDALRGAECALAK